MRIFIVSLMAVALSGSVMAAEPVSSPAATPVKAASAAKPEIKASKVSVHKAKHATKAPDTAK